jgi:RNA polymerase subunit RPABC4/transcription elongation factor Spt4
MKKYCTNCGKKMEEDAEFCVYCGHELVKERGKTAVFGEKEEELTKDAKGKITIVTGLLLALLGIRFIGSLVLTFVNPFAVLDLVVYLLIIVGVSLKAKWGSLLAIGYHVLAFLVIPFIPYSYPDASAAFIAGAIAGAITMNLLITGLAWKEYSSLKEWSKRVKRECALQTA